MYYERKASFKASKKKLKTVHNYRATYGSWTKKCKIFNWMYYEFVSPAILKYSPHATL